MKFTKLRLIPIIILFFLYAGFWVGYFLINDVHHSNDLCAIALDSFTPTNKVTSPNTIQPSLSGLTCSEDYFFTIGNDSTNYFLYKMGFRSDKLDISTMSIPFPVDKYAIDTRFASVLDDHYIAPIISTDDNSYFLIYSFNDDKLYNLTIPNKSFEVRSTIYGHINSNQGTLAFLSSFKDSAAGSMVMGVDIQSSSIKYQANDLLSGLFNTGSYIGQLAYNQIDGALCYRYYTSTTADSGVKCIDSITGETKWSDSFPEGINYDTISSISMYSDTHFFLTSCVTASNSCFPMRLYNYNEGTFIAGAKPNYLFFDYNMYPPSHSSIHYDDSLIFIASVNHVSSYLTTMWDVEQKAYWEVDIPPISGTDLDSIIGRPIATNDNAVIVVTRTGFYKYFSNSTNNGELAYKYLVSRMIYEDPRSFCHLHNNSNDNTDYLVLLSHSAKVTSLKVFDVSENAKTQFCTLTKSAIKVVFLVFAIILSIVFGLLIFIFATWKVIDRVSNKWSEPLLAVDGDSDSASSFNSTL